MGWGGGGPTSTTVSIAHSMCLIIALDEKMDTRLCLKVTGVISPRKYEERIGKERQVTIRDQKIGEKGVYRELEERILE